MRNFSLNDSINNIVPIFSDIILEVVHHTIGKKRINGEKNEHLGGMRNVEKKEPLRTKRTKGTNKTNFEEKQETLMEKFCDEISTSTNIKEVWSTIKR
ncbi:hypothetical protein HHI36_001446 [Cryptolaemus montrouzieri]|uniref:Uncharacterized protein n=1 Tax=Cryptolaemus montrouzieri TaxID=559131 RepID=A0ABD2P7Y0_9CUCU